MTLVLDVETRMLGGAIGGCVEPGVAEWSMRVLRRKGLQGSHLVSLESTRALTIDVRGSVGGAAVVNRSYHDRMRLRSTGKRHVFRQVSKVVRRVKLHLHETTVTAIGLIRSKDVK